LVYLMKKKWALWIKTPIEIKQYDLTCDEKTKRKWRVGDGNAYFSEVKKFFSNGKFFIIANNHIAYLESGKIYDIYNEKITIVKYIIRLK
jgi:hypothetical protein